MRNGSLDGTSPGPRARAACASLTRARASTAVSAVILAQLHRALRVVGPGLAGASVRRPGRLQGGRRLRGTLGQLRRRPLPTDGHGRSAFHGTYPDPRARAAWSTPDNGMSWRLTLHPRRPGEGPCLVVPTLANLIIRSTSSKRIIAGSQIMPSLHSQATLRDPHTGFDIQDVGGRCGVGRALDDT